MKATCGVFIGNVRYPPQLPGTNFSVRQFYTDHLYPFLPLAIYTSGQAKASEFLLIEFPFLKLTDFSLEFEDVPGYYRILYFCSKALHFFLFHLSIL
jgi:hypothetical protein